MDEAARVAVDYSLTPKVSFVNKTKPTFSHNNSKVTSSNDYSLQSQSSAPKQRLFHDTKGQNPLSQPTCNYCKKPGHLISECLTLKRKQQQRDETKPQVSPL